MENVKIKIGAVGIGKLGATHARNIANNIVNAELHAVCSRTLVNAVVLQKELSVPFAYDDYDEMLENKELDAVCITTYTRFHPEQILKALGKGLAVFCDKPLAANYEESKKLVEEIEKKYPDKICMIGFMKRYDPSYLYVKKQIEIGKLGTPILFKGYAVDSQKVTEKAKGYIEESEGIFYDFFVHDFDLSRWLVGSDWAFDTVNSLGSNYLFKEFEEQNDLDNATCLAQFQNGMMGFYYCGRTAPHGYLVETEIIGTDAIFRIGNSPSKNLVEIMDTRGNVKEEHAIFLDRFEQAYINELQEFVNCIIKNILPKNTIQDALEASRMAYFADKSFRQKKQITL